MDRETILCEMIIDFLDTPSICRLASTSKSLHDALRETTLNLKHMAYVRLRHLDTATDLFSVQRTWKQFNALYIVRKETSVRRRVFKTRITAREYQFGFYTGAKDKWHHCFLTLPAFSTGLGARLRVTSYDRHDERILTRTFSGIFRIENLIRILETQHWHSYTCMFVSRWSYIEDVARSVLVLRLEE
jgi:hypothetical protein